MKVLDLHCAEDHVFEGWFASEEDFLAQQQRGLVSCPMCGDSAVTKMLSAPRLNLGSPRVSEEPKQDVVATTDPTAREMQAAWTDFRPAMPVPDGVAKFVAWYRDYYKA